MKIFPVLLCLQFVNVAIAVAYTQFCATISPGQADGASGFVAMQIENGQAKISIDLSLSNYPLPSTCSLQEFQKGLKYHIHSYWNNATATSSANGYCGTGFTGGHYDPNFACSASSQSATTYCPKLNRTTATHYTYSCNSTNYNAGKYSLCEVGDLSGKSGVLTPLIKNGTVYVLPLFTDNLPAYVFNYNQADLTSLPWMSIVFHCFNSANTRLVCAKFSPTVLSACTNAFNAFNSADSSSSISSDDDVKLSKTSFAVATVLVLLFVFLMGLCTAILSIHYCKRFQETPEAASPGGTSQNPLI